MAFGYDGSVRIKADLNHSPFDRGLSAMTGSVNKFGNTLKKIGGMVAVAFGTAALINFGKESIKLASDIEEVQNVIDVTFGQGAAQIEEFAKSAAEAFGLSELSAKQYAGTMGAMLKSSGLATSAAQEMSTTLAGLAGDVASFYNLDTDTAFEKIRSGISGETEPLKQLGINMSVANLEAYALAQGITKSYNAMSQSEQVLLRYNYLLGVTTDAQGDFARTSGSFANQIRILQLNFDQLRIAVGNALIPIAQAVLPGINAIISALTKLATVFAQVTALLFGKSAEVKATSGIASSAGAAAGATDRLAEATKGAGDAAKQTAKDMKGVLAGFDELNILADNAAGSVGGAGGGSGGGGIGDIALPDIGPGGELWGDATVNPEIEQGIQAIIDKAKELSAIFAEGFKFGLGDVDFSGIMESLQAIGGYLREIFTDSDVMAAANRFVESFVFAVGTLTGSIASIGITIASAVLGGIEIFLAENGDRIKSWIVRIFDAGTEINELLATFSAAFSEVFSVFGEEEAQEIIASAIGIFSSIFGGSIELAVKFARDMIDTITTPFVENKDLIVEALRGFLEPIQKVMDDIELAVRDAVDNIVALYDEHIHPFIMTVKEAFTEWFEHVLDGFNTYIKPVLDDFAEKFDDVVNNHVVPMVEKAMLYFGKAADMIQRVWEKFLKPVVSWIIDTAVPFIAVQLAYLGDRFNTFLAVVSDVVGGIFEVLGGLIDFLTGVFTGDWNLALEGIKEIFKGVWNGIVGLLEGAVNFIIGGINRLIRALNVLHIDIPATPWTDAFRVGFNIPPIGEIQLPRLANGAVIPPNQQFAAILGDQRSGMNIEAPLKTIEQAVENVLGRSGFGGDINITVESVLDGKVVARNTVRHINAMTRSTGKPVLLG